MDMNYLVQRKINAKKQYRRKVTAIIALSAILLVLVLVGLIKIMSDEKESESGKQTTENQVNHVQNTESQTSGSSDGSGETADNSVETNGTAEGAETPAEPTMTPAMTSTPTPTPVPAKKVAIDPGHGGEDDLGSPRNGLYEKNANLAIALYLREELEGRGYATYMIRETDEAVDNKARPGMALENGADIYVSIHLNSLEEDSDATQGAEAWYSDLRNDGSDKLAQNVVDELTAVVGTRNRGIKLSNNLIVLKYNELPACLVECGFMSSAPEREKLFDPEYQKKIAEGIANGIEKFLPLE